MSVLSAEQVGHIYSDNWLFRNLSFGLQKGDRVALVGVNGAGKSTLLHIIAGHLQPTEGKVVSEKGNRLGYLPQHPEFKGVDTIYDFVYNADSTQQKLIRSYEELLNHAEPDQQQLTALTDQLSTSGAWEYEHNIKSILYRLQLTDFSQKIDNLSGGQRKRLALAKLLIDDPDIYVLDEPTNHLDIETIEWLEKTLTAGQKTVLLITHDRYFLDQVCTEIRELSDGFVHNYTGSYRYFLEKKAERETVHETLLERNRNLLRRELEWIRRQPQARGTKSKSRIEAFQKLEADTRKVKSNESVRLNIKMNRQGTKILELDGLSKSFNGRQVIDGFSYVFKKGDRIGLAGKNGSGKSTLLNLVTGELVPDEGTVVPGETTVFGYYKQGGLGFDENDRVIDVVTQVADHITMANGEVLSAQQLLTQFLFPPKKQFGLIRKLSGGERKRLQLMRVLMQNPNFLILDEPTNDLDLDTLNVLEEFLLNFPGVLLIVSHDRYLLDKLTHQLFIMETDGKIEIHNGNYADYKQVQDTVLRERKVNETKATEKPVSPEAKRKLSYKERQELANLDEIIPSLEGKIEEQTRALNQTTDHKEITAIANEIEQLNKELDTKTARWVFLGDLL